MAYNNELEKTENKIMKTILLSLVAIATISFTSLGQSPEGFKYQAVIRDAGNLILTDQAVGMQLSIQQGSIGGTSVYTETFSITTAWSVSMRFPASLITA